MYKDFCKEHELIYSYWLNIQLTAPAALHNLLHLRGVVKRGLNEGGGVRGSHAAPLAVVQLRRLEVNVVALHLPVGLRRQQRQWRGKHTTRWKV